MNKLNRVALHAITVATILAAASSDAQTLNECVNLKVDKARLSCFDKFAKTNLENQAKAQAAQSANAAAAKQAADAEKANPNWITPEIAEAAKLALKQINRLGAAAEVGISLRDYGTKIADVSGEFKDAINVIPDSELKRELQGAFGEHILAREFWSAMLDAGYSEVFQKVYCPKLIELYQMTPCIIQGVFNNATKRMPVTESSKREVLSLPWAKARKHIATAQMLLEMKTLNAPAKSVMMMQ